MWKFLTPKLCFTMSNSKHRKTGKSAGRAASKVLKDKRTSKDSKKVAGSALSQRAPKKKNTKKKKK